MVAVKTPSLAETYKALCQTLQQNPKLSVPVVNHIAAKHGIHSLPAFHITTGITDAEKHSTYGEIIKALIAHGAGDAKALGQLQGKNASGQASPAPAPAPEPAPHPLSGRDSVLPKSAPDEDEDRIRTVMTPEPPPSRIPPPPPPRAAAPKAAESGAEAQLREALSKFLGPQTLDADEINRLVDEKLETALAGQIDTVTTNVSEMLNKAIEEAKAALKKEQQPTVIVHEFKIGAEVRPVKGIIHRQLPQVVAWLNADVPVWLWGQAGGGKTHLARQAAEALGLPFYCAPIDETITVGKLVGFRNVSTGEFVEGLMYRSYKFGGVQLLDEVDNNATALAATNSLIANGHYTFPNGEEVARHKDFRLIAGGNTKGTGAVAGYTARVRMDAATLDRFAIIKLDYDPAMEIALACGQVVPSTPWAPTTPADNDACRRYVDWVQRVRAKVGESVLISPRASYLGVRALRAGIPLAEVCEALVFKLVAPDTRARVQSECGAVPSR